MKTLATSAILFVGVGASFGISLIYALEKPFDSIDEYVRILETQVAGGLALGLFVATVGLVWAIKRIRRIGRELAFDRDWVRKTNYF